MSFANIHFIIGAKMSLKLCPVVSFLAAHGVILIVLFGQSNFGLLVVPF